MSRMTDIERLVRCPRLHEPNIDDVDPDGCTGCTWETWRCHQSMAQYLRDTEQITPDSNWDARCPNPVDVTTYGNPHNSESICGCKDTQHDTPPLPTT